MSERWPGLMRRTTAARYCELTLAKFERAVATGELPMPVKINGEDRWYRHQIDARGASCWRIHPDGKIGPRPFATIFAQPAWEDAA